MYAKFVKRLLDIILSVVALVLLSPLFLILAIWIKADTGGPVLFRQKRIGINKRTFNILKFRTMRVDVPHDMPTHMLRNPEECITRSGRFLRRSSLDELPQLWNILIGQMSFIGPRPALWNQTDLIAERDKYGVNDVLPGLTGWAQINGRDELELPAKVRRDVEYVMNISFKMDMTIFFITVGNVLKSKGVVEGGTGMLAPHIAARREEVRQKEKG